jgi:dihydroorotase
MRSVLLTGGRLIDPAQGVDGAFDLLLTDGVVAAVGPPGSLQERATAASGARQGEALERIELRGEVVCPGLIDIHVHFREPGQESKETVATGSAAAVAGGLHARRLHGEHPSANDNGWVTGVIVRAAELAAKARVHPIGAISKGLEGKELAPMGAMVAAGAVAVSDDGRPVSNAELMRRALEYAQHFGIPVIQHAQDMDLTGDGVMHEGEWSVRSGMPGIPGLAEDVMVARDLLLVEETGGRYHLAHMSTARTAGLVREAKRRGLPVTCEVTPHHLLLTDQSVVEAGFDAQFKMNPPLRADRDRQACWPRSPTARWTPSRATMLPTLRTRSASSSSSHRSAFSGSKRPSRSASSTSCGRVISRSASSSSCSPADRRACSDCREARSLRVRRRTSRSSTWSADRPSSRGASGASRATLRSAAGRSPAAL